MWPKEHEHKIKKKTDFIYPILPLFEIDNKLYKLVFNLRYLKSLPIKGLKRRKALFRLRHSFLVDIQANIARHINRPGIISL